MIQAIDRVALLMALMRQLEEVMRAENALLGQMRLERLAELEMEKTALAQGYELELRRFRQTPELLTQLAAEERQLLDQAMRSFQAALQANARRLVQAQGVVEDILRTIRDSVAAGQGRSQAYALRERSGTNPGGRVIAVAFDRQL